LSFRYWIGSDEKTLSSEDIDKANRQILQTLETDLGAKLRA
jgi:phenylalanyl-tRNA synthetase beta subunit